MSRPADILLRQGDSTPAWPTSGQISFYAKSNGVFYSLDSNGVETPLGGGSGTVTSVSILANPSRLVATGNPITSSGSIALDLAETSVIAGSYTNANITVDAYGRITSATNGSSSGGVSSFNTRSGDITLLSSDVTTALGFTPYDSTNPNGYTSNTGTVTNVTGTGTVSGLTLTGSVSTTGSLTLGGTLALLSSDVTTALGFTPYNATNPAGYITGITGSDVTTALGFTPYNASNPAGYITGITSSDITTALGYTPGTGNGTVTSVGSEGINGVTVSGSPITGSGTITIGLGDITPTSVSATGSVTGLNLSGTNTGDETTASIKSKLGITTLSGSNTGDQTITLTGDVTGSGTGSFPATLSTTGVVANTYGSATQVPVFTVDAKGRITGVTNTTITAGSGTVTSVSGTGTVSGITLSGTVTDSGSLTLGGTLSLTSIQVTDALGYTPYDSTNPNGYTSNVGTVTSVSGTGTVSGLTLTGNVTGSGSLTLGGTLSLTSGQVTTALGFTPYNATNPAGYTSNTGTVTSVTVSGGSTGLSFSDTPITTTGTATMSGTLAIANGGTGQTTATGAINALMPSQTGNTGKFLTTNGTNLSWATVATGSGTVTSVSASGSNGVTISGSPITTTGTINIGLGAITPNSVASTGTVTGSNLSGTNTGDQTITLTGDVTGSGTGTFATTLSTTGVVAGSYTNTNITVDEKGRIIAASNGATGTGVTGYYGAFQDITNQVAASTTASYPIDIGITDEHNGVNIVSGNRVSFSYAGTYNIQYSIQFTNTDTLINDVNIWIRKNGVDVADSNSVFSVSGKHGSVNGHLIAAVNYVLTVATNDYVQVMWSTGNVQTFIESIAAQTNPTVPLTPGIILTATQVMNLQVGPGVVAGGTAGQVLAKIDGTDYNTEWVTPTNGTVTSITVNGTSGRLTSTGSPVTTTGTITMDLATTTVTAGTYGSATQVPVMTVDAYGRVTGVTNTTISGGGSSGTSETVIFRYDTGSGGAMTGADAIQSQTSGVTATITSGAACTCTFSFTGKSNPPKTITTYAQNTSSNNFLVKDTTAYLSGNNPGIAGGGTVASPAILTSFTSSNILTLTLTQATTGAVGGIGLRAYLMVVFGF